MKMKISLIIISYYVPSIHRNYIFGYSKCPLAKSGHLPDYPTIY